MDKSQNKSDHPIPPNAYELDDAGVYFNGFKHHVGSERFNSEDCDPRMDRIRRSTEEFLKMKRDEFWDTHKDSIEDTRMINEAAEYHEQITLMRQLEEEDRLQRQQQEREMKQQQLLLAQQQAFKQQQPLQQAQPTAPQLQALLMQIEQTLHHLQVQYTQQTQLLQRNYQPIVMNLTAQLTKAIQMNDADNIQRLRLQQHSIQQQFQSQVAVLQQQLTVQSQSLQATQLNIKTALHNALQIHSIQPIQSMPAIPQKAIPHKPIPEFRPSKHVQLQEETSQDVHNTADSKQIYTIQENETHIIDEDQSKNSAHSDTETRRDDNVSCKSINHDAIKPRLASQSLSSQLSSQSVSKSPATTVGPNFLSPSISPMKLPYASHSAVSSPAGHPSVSLRLPHILMQSQTQIAMTQSLPNSPSIGVQSLAEISKVSLTPQLPRHRIKKHAAGSSSNKLIKSVPNSPSGFNLSSRNMKRKIKRKEVLSPLILNGPYSSHQQPTFAFNETPPPILPKIVSTEEIFDGPPREITPPQSSPSTSGNSTPTHSEEETEQKSSTFTSTGVARKDSLNSLYSYSSMSTVFTGVHDGMLLANHSVYLSQMNGHSQYNKMSVVNDIKSLWLQVFGIPVLCTVIQTLLIRWLSVHGGDGRVNQSQLAGFLLGITVFNMIAQLMVKGMTATLSSICDELYNANCKPLIGVALQKMIGFAVVIIMPLVMCVMFSIKCAIIYIYRHHIKMGHDGREELVHAMDDMIQYCMFSVAPLTLFYVFQRYLQGSHVLHVNGYVAACLVSALVVELAILLLLQNQNVYHVVLVSMVCAYAVLFVSFMVAIHIYKLHLETFALGIEWKHLCCPRQWIKYISRGLCRSALLFCMFWYFDFMIIMAGTKGINELIAFGILCNIYHVIRSMISAAEFVAKSLIFRGLLYSSIEYARDAWKYTIFFGFFLSVIIGGVFFLMREHISAFFSVDSKIQSIMNDSWLYLYILIIANGIKYGFVGGAQAMGYVKWITAINLVSFYCVSIPVAVWSQYYRNNATITSIYLSILCGFVLNIICLLIFRLSIDWHRELKLFTLRAHQEAQTLQQSVEAVHIQLQHYHNKGRRRHKHTHRHRHHRKHTTKRDNKKIESVNSFGCVTEMPLGRQATNDTIATNATATATATMDCQCTQCGEPQLMVKQERKGKGKGKRKRKRKRRTIWEDLFDALKEHCCCCLFDGCCTCCSGGTECCEEWWYYCCGCCCSDSYLRDDYDNKYHMDITDDAKYQIIHEDACANNKPTIKLEIHNDDLKHSLISQAGVPANYI